MAQEGWICPRCGKVNAPWMTQCTCSTQNEMKITCNGANTTCTCKEAPKFETNTTNNQQMIFS